MNGSHESHRPLARIGALALTTTLAVLMVPGRAEATNTRVWTLGVMNRFVLDDANRWLYPHVITKYGNLFYVELYGYGDSLGVAAPDSQRLGRDTPGSMLIDADLTPVQANAGGGVILGITDDLFVSFHLSDYENPVVRNFLEQDLASVSQGNPNAFPWLGGSGAAPRPISDANRKFDVFAAYNIQDLAALGLLFTFGSSKYKYLPNDTDPDILGGDDTLSRADDELGTQEWRVLLSAGLEPTDALAIDAAFGFAIHGLTYLPNLRSEILDGGGGFELQGDVRSVIGITEWWELIPAVSFRMGKLSGADLASYGSGLTYNNSSPERSNTNVTDISISMLMLDVGVAGHFRPSDIVQFWGAAGFQLLRTAQQYDHFSGEDPNAAPPIIRDNPLEYARTARTADAFPYLKLGLEARVFSWLDFRGGVVKYLRADGVNSQAIDDQANQNNRDNDVVQDQPFFDYFIGFAAHYEGFFLDMQLDPNWFKRGPDFLSGSGGDMFINGSLGYRY